jgi:hypothetical protein
MGKRLQRARRQSFFLLIPCIFALSVTFSACGTNTGSGGVRPLTSSTQPATSPQATPSATHSSASPSPTATSNAAQSVGSASYGCPNKLVMAAPPPAATVTLKQAKNGAAVTVHKGDTVEVALLFGPA